MSQCCSQYVREIAKCEVKTRAAKSRHAPVRPVEQVFPDRAVLLLLHSPIGAIRGQRQKRRNNQSKPLN